MGEPARTYQGRNGNDRSPHALSLGLTAVYIPQAGTVQVRWGHGVHTRQAQGDLWLILSAIERLSEGEQWRVLADPVAHDGISFTGAIRFEWAGDGPAVGPTERERAGKVISLAITENETPEASRELDIRQAISACYAAEAHAALNPEAESALVAARAAVHEALIPFQGSYLHMDKVFELAGNKGFYTRPLRSGEKIP